MIFSYEAILKRNMWKKLLKFQLSKRSDSNNVILTKLLNIAKKFKMLVLQFIVYTYYNGKINKLVNNHFFLFFALSH